MSDLHRSLVFLLTMAFSWSTSAADVASFAVEAGEDALRPRFVVSLSTEALPGDGQLQLFRLDPKTGERGPPVFGTVKTDAGKAVFEPEFRLSAGGRYRATYARPGKPSISLDYTIPAAADDKPGFVESVYPSGDKLPANLLKFYVYFSRPMRPSDKIFDRMHILNEKGQAVHDPWRRFQQWSDDGKRLTLWIHPGRVKQGVNLREEFGPVLVPGQQFTLKLEATLEDLAGKPMAAAFEKQFTATAEDRERIAVDVWKIAAPKAGSRDPLRVTFPKPLDHALLTRLISVRDDAGRTIEGRVDVSIGETAWAFTPASSWTNNAYEVVADELLEDLSGNTPVRVFDADMNAINPNTKLTSRTFQPVSPGAKPW